MNDVTQIKKHLATINDFKLIFSSPQGQRVLWDLMREANMVGPIVVRRETGIDVHETFMAEGARNLVLYILTKLKFNERTLLKKIEENTKGENYDIDGGDGIF